MLKPSECTRTEYYYSMTMNVAFVVGYEVCGIAILGIHFSGNVEWSISLQGVVSETMAACVVIVILSSRPWWSTKIKFSKEIFMVNSLTDHLNERTANRMASRSGTERKGIFVPSTSLWLRYRP